MFDSRGITGCYKRGKWNILLGVLEFRLRPVALGHPPRPADGRVGLKWVTEILEYLKYVHETRRRGCVQSEWNQNVTLWPCLPGSPDSPLIPLWPCEQEQQQYFKVQNWHQYTKQVAKWCENRPWWWCSHYLHSRETRVPVQSRGTSIRALKHTTGYFEVMEGPCLLISYFRT